MIKPDCYAHIGEIIAMIERAGFKIKRVKMSKFEANTASNFYNEHVDKSFFPKLLTFITSDLCVGMELVREDAIKRWRQVIGPTNTLSAQ